MTTSFAWNASLQDVDEVFHKSITPISCIHEGVLQELILWVFMFRYTRDWEHTCVSALYERLATVNVSWRAAMKRRSFLRRLRRSVRDFYKDKIKELIVGQRLTVVEKSLSCTTLTISLKYEFFIADLWQSLLSLHVQDVRLLKGQDCTQIHNLEQSTPNKLVFLKDQTFLDIDSADNYEYTPLFLIAFVGHTSLYNKLSLLGARRIIPTKIKHMDLVLFASGFCDDLECMKDLFNHVYKPGSHDPSIELLHLLLENEYQPGTSSAMNILEEHSIDINAKNNDGDSALLMAAACDRIDTINLLLAHGADIHTMDNHNHNVLHAAAMFGRSRVLDYFRSVNIGLEMSSSDKYGLSLVHHAIQCNSETLKLLCNTEMLDINEKTNQGETSLHLAAQCGNMEQFQVLLEVGADKNASSNNGSNLLHFASAGGDMNIIRNILLDKTSIDVNARNNEGETPLHVAARGGKLEVMKLLLSHGADIHAVDNEKNNVLHVAALCGQEYTLKFILTVDQKPDISLRRNNGYNLLHCASVSGLSEVLDTLLYTKKMAINERNDDGETALHIAARCGKLDVVQFLCEHDADIHAVDNNGQNVLHKASASDQDLVVKYLIASNTNAMYLYITTRSSYGYMPFHQAAFGGNVKILETLFNTFTLDINIRTSYNRTALHVTAEHGHLEALKFLLAKGADFEAVDYDGRTALLIAVNHGHIEIVTRLLTRGSDVHAVDYEGMNALQIAALQGQVNVFNFLLCNDDIPEINAPFQSGFNLLHIAAGYCSMEILKAIVDKKLFDINVKADNGETPLHIAARCGAIDAVKFLIESEANMSLLDSNGYNVLHTAALYSQDGVIECVLNKSGITPNVSAKTRSGFSVLHVAARTGSINILKILLEKTFLSVNEVTDDGETASHIAVRHDKLEALKFLLERGADMHAVDRSGSNLFHCAAVSGSVSILEFLLSDNNICNVNESSTEGETALHIVARCGKLDAVKFLLEYGADIYAADNEGLTPVHAAVEYSQDDVVQYLIAIVDSMLNNEDKFHYGTACNKPVILQDFSRMKTLNASNNEDETDTALHTDLEFNEVHQLVDLPEQGSADGVTDNESLETRCALAAELMQLENLHLIQELVCAGQMASPSNSHSPETEQKLENASMPSKSEDVSHAAPIFSRRKTGLSGTSERSGTHCLCCAIV